MSISINQLPISAPRERAQAGRQAGRQARCTRYLGAFLLAELFYDAISFRERFRNVKRVLISGENGISILFGGLNLAEHLVKAKNSSSANRPIASLDTAEAWARETRGDDEALPHKNMKFR
jgi:hypothetical protein